MVLRLLRMSLIVAAALVAWNVGMDTRGEAQAAHVYSPDLFYNYYVGPGPGSVGAQMYPCPRPTPPRVGHTYVTYQPLMPHEFLYRHHRCYYRRNPGAGWTKTMVWWQ